MGVGVGVNIGAGVIGVGVIGMTGTGLTGIGAGATGVGANGPAVAASEHINKTQGRAKNVRMVDSLF